MRCRSPFVSLALAAILVSAAATSAVAQSVAVSPASQPPTADLQRAAAVFAQSNWKEAHVAYTDLAARYPQHALSRVRVGVTLTELGRAAEGEPYLRAGEQLGFPAPQAAFRLAESLAEQTKPDAAMRELRRAIGAGFFVLPSTLEANAHFASLKTHPQWRLVIDTLDTIVHPCRHDARYREFDFWIGDWEVRQVGTATGPASRNRITLEENGCVVMEHWVGLGGSTGQSFNLFDRSTGLWRQTWVDNVGGQHDYSGSLVGGNMVLTGTTPAANGQLGRVPTKLTLFHVSKDTVRQFAQTSADSGKTWTTSYDLLYVRAVSAQTPTDTQITSRVDEYMQRLAALGYTGGVLVVRDGRPLFTRSYGMANREAAIKADTSTVYSLGSITKQFTAAAILRLEERGALRTTDSLARFFPNAPADKRGITVHQLLTHTAGFNSDFSPTDYEPTTRDEYVRRMFAAPLRTMPGTTFFYANSGYSLLAAIIEITTMQEYEAALRELILRPAGMLQTGYRLPAWNAARIAHGYQEGRDWGTIAERIAVPGGPYWELRGNGGLQTTLGDMARWDAALNDRRMMTDSSRRKFMTGYVNEGPAGLSQYAYGWAVSRTSRGTRLVEHNGGNGIYVAELLRFVDDHVTIFVTSTVSDLTATAAVRVLSKIVFGQPYELPPVRVAVRAQALAAAQGTYMLRDGSRLVVHAQDGRLMAEAVGQQAFQLLATGDTASPPAFTQLNTRSRAIVEAVVNGNVGPLRAALGPGGPDSADVASQEAELLADRKQRFGALQSIDVLGTSTGPGGGMRTTVRINFAKGGATNMYTWDGKGVIMDIGARPFAPTELLPGANGEFRTLDVRGGAGARLTFAKGTATAITPNGIVHLTRQRP